MESNQLNFLGKNPGASKFGNFINYYSFNSVEERLKCLHPKMIPPPLNEEPYLCLDIGCNSGELSYELNQYIKLLYPNCKVHILAVDIDPKLIQRANESFNDYKNMTFQTLDVTSYSGQHIIRNYLTSFNKTCFDVIFCFSVTMWIHLNIGDNGLLEFLEYVKNISKTIVIEPQPWNCYRNAQRRLKKSGETFDLYPKLKIRSNVDYEIENRIRDTHPKICESSNTIWKRKVKCFQKKG